MTNLFSPPPTSVLPLSLGRDVILTFRNKVPGSDPAVYTDFPPNVSVRLEIGKGSSKISSSGTVSGSSATCRIESSVADTVKPGALWRVVVSLGNGSGNPTSDEVPLNGKVVRSDGA